MKDRLVEGAYAGGWALVKALPEPLARALFRAVADVAWWRRGSGVRRLEVNLGRVLGPAATPEQVRALSRTGMRSYLRYWQEAFRLPVWSDARVVGTFHAEGVHHLRDAMATGRGAVAALPHSGNWDHAGAWAVRCGFPLTTVAERLRPESLYDRFVAYREHLGMEVLPLTGGAEDVYTALSSRLRAGRFVCLLADRDLRTTGVKVDFFGSTARMPGGPAALALDTGAALLPVTLWYADDGTHLCFHPPVPLPSEGARAERLAAMTQHVADVFEAGIRAHPEDWHMLQRLWPDDVPGRRRTEV
ncbi:MAG: phosphatidylinositol mannoside acyltransferase [Actinomycetes bacterium]